MNSKKIIEVHCDSIDYEHLYITCPFCYSRYNKDGTPSKNAKRVVHIHKSNEDFSNRIEQRIPHCPTKKRNYIFNIVIDDKTERK